MKKLTTKDIKNKFKNIHPELTLLENFTNTRTPILVKDIYNVKYKVYLSTLTKGVIPTIQAAIDKNHCFSVKANLVHSNKYDYSKINYTNNKNKITIICPTHGIFLQTPANHLMGQICPKCNLILQGKNRKLNINDFINRSNKIHDYKYKYNNVNYINNSIKVDIKCSIHGYFEQSPAEHLNGCGCPKCAKENNSGYSKTQWVTFCNKHTNRTPITYIVRLFNKNEEFIKIGITTVSLPKRFSTIPYSYEVLKELKGSSDFVFDKEKELHKLCKKYSYKPYKSFGGETECFTTNCLSLLPL